MITHNSWRTGKPGSGWPGIIFAFLALASGAFGQALTPVDAPPAVVADSVRLAADSAAVRSANDSLADTVTYSAHRIRYRNDSFSLTEKALLTYRGSQLRADTILFFNDRDLVEAMGRPVVTDVGNPPIYGEKMRYNLKTKVGEIYYGYSRRDREMFTGVEIRRQPSGEIYIARGCFSTCEDPTDTYFYSRRMIVEPNQRALSGPIVMNIQEVPVAVLPMMYLPLGKGRRSGLLQPKFGGDQTQGFYLLGMGFYWATSEYMDLQLSGDIIEGESGTFDKTNLNWDYRYSRRYRLTGSLGGKYYISEFNPANSGWHTDFTHDQSITPDGRQTLKGGGRFQSDSRVVDQNALTEEEKVRQTANANLGYRRQFDWMGASLNLNLNQDHNLAEDLVDRSIPDFTFRAGGPLFSMARSDWIDDVEPNLERWYHKLNFNYDNRFNVNQVQRPEIGASPPDSNVYVGYTHQAGLRGKYQLGNYINLTPSANFRQIWSLHSRDPAGLPEIDYDPGAGRLGDHFSFFNTGFDLDTRLYGIAMAGANPWFGAVEGIRHTVIPQIGLLFAPELDSNTHYYPHPKIGGTAYQAEERTVGFQLGNEVEMKLAGGADKKAEPAKTMKVLSANSSTNYNFARDREWADISSSFTAYFTPTIPFTLNTTHSLYDPFETDPAIRDQVIFPLLTSYGFNWRKGITVGGDFNTGARAETNAGLPSEKFSQSPWSAGLNYSFDFRANRVAPDVFRLTRTHQADARIKLNPTPGWDMSYATDYNFSEGTFTKHSFGFLRTISCWDMEFSWTPVGISEGWRFLIRLRDLPDLKLETSDTRTRRLGE